MLVPKLRIGPQRDRIGVSPFLHQVAVVEVRKEVEREGEHSAS